MVALATVLFGVAAAVAVTIVATLLVTLTTRVRLWPPGDDARKAALHWGLVGAFDVGILAVAALRWNAWILPRPSSLVVGAVLSVCGAAVFFHSSRAMSADETTGRVADELYTDGLYARSRNPQYLGMMIGLVGFALLVNSTYVAVLVVAHVCWLVLLPFAEEPWLREQFGDEYDRYCDRVPRFVGFRSIGLA